MLEQACTHLDIAMNLTKLSPLCALLFCVACDSSSLGGEPIIPDPSNCEELVVLIEIPELPANALVEMEQYEDGRPEVIFDDCTGSGRAELTEAPEGWTRLSLWGFAGPSSFRLRVASRTSCDVDAKTIVAVSAIATEDSPGATCPSATTEIVKEDMILPERLTLRERTAFQHIGAREDGSMVVAGPSGYAGVFGDLAVYTDLYVGVFDTNGALLWEDERPLAVSEFGEVKEGEIKGIGTGPDGTVFVAQIDYGDDTDSDNQVLKYGNDGELLWTTPTPARPFDVVGTMDGGAVVVGQLHDVNNPGVVQGWAARLDADGSIVDTRSWENGRDTFFEHVAASKDSIVLGGRWGTSTLDSSSEAWLLWIDDELNTQAELRLPYSGASDRIDDLRIDENGAALALAALDVLSVVRATPDNGLISTTPVDASLAALSPYAAEAYLATRSDCTDETGDSPCGTHIHAVDGGKTPWGAYLEGCAPTSGFAVDRQEFFFSVGCTFKDDDGLWDFRSELHRVRVD